MDSTLILIQCADRTGLVASVAKVLAGYGLNIEAMREYVDVEASLFFARVSCSGTLSDGQHLLEDLKNKLPQDASVIINPPSPKKLAVLVTKEYHCLGDILSRNFFKTPETDVCAVIGNHDYLRDFTEGFNVPYYHVASDGKSKEAFEEEVLQILDRYNPDYLVLAKFMRILSPEFLARYPNRVINIHHSFLPAFAGAHPYRRAFERGVKLIGATAHFVTPELDAGPIISQQTIKIDHTYTVAQMVEAGQEVEKTVLSRALKLVARDQVFISGNKTIVFE
jgi:formyltetrahydrofolate deformylase